MKTNIIRRTLTILTLALCICGTAAADVTIKPTLATGGIEQDIYLGSDFSTTSSASTASYLYSGLLDQVLTDMKKVNNGSEITQISLSQKVYLRWYVLDSENAQVSFTTTQNSEFYFSFYLNQSNVYPLGKSSSTNDVDDDNVLRWYYQKVYWNGLDMSKYLSYALNPKLVSAVNATTLKGYVIVLEVSDGYDSSTITSGVSSKESEEGFFKLRYIFHFDEEPNTFINSLKTGGKTAAHSVELKAAETEDQSAAFSYSEASGTPTVTINLNNDSETLGECASGVKYARWYFVDSEGKQIDQPSGVTLSVTTADGFTQETTNTKNGFYWYNSTTASTTPISGVTISGTQDVLADCHLVCVMSKDATDIILTNGTVTTEPSWDVQYYINFEKPFKGDATNAKTYSAVYKLPTSKWSGLYSASVSLDYTNAQFKLATKTGQYPDGWSLTADCSQFISDNSLSETLSDGGTFYVRWFLRNKDTKVEYDASTCLSSTLSTYVNDGNNHFYWYSGLDTNNKTLADILKVTVTPNGLNLTDCELVAHISTGSAADYVSDGKLTHEPDNITAEYVFSFVGRGFEAENLSSLTSSQIIERTAFVKSNHIPNINFYTDEQATVESALTNFSTSGSRYARWYIEDADGNIVVGAATDGSTNNDRWTEVSGYGYYTYNWGLGSFDQKITLTEDIYTKIQNGETYKVVFLLTDDLTNQVTESNTLLCEPDIKLKYVYTLFTDASKLTTFRDLSKTTKRVVTEVVTAEATSTTVNLYTTMGDRIKRAVSDYTTLDNYENIKYLHWYFVDKDTDEPLSDMVQGNFAPTNTTSWSGISGFDDAKGFVKYYTSTAFPTASSTATDNYEFTLTVPTGKKLTDVKAVCVLSNSVSGIITDGGLEEPTKLNYAIIINFVSTAPAFKHYVGYAYNNTANESCVTDGSTPINEDGITPEVWEEHNGKKYQKVHDWEYDIYVKPGETVTLNLPLQATNLLEPEGYIRWYDYDTDAKSNQVSQTKASVMNETGIGLWVFDYQQANSGVGTDVTDVTFTAPASNWTGSVIACDVSRYVDGVSNLDKTQMYREPTLSLRYIFNIKPATVIADALKNAIIASKGDDVYEDYGYVTIGLSADDETTGSGDSKTSRTMTINNKSYTFKKGETNLRVNLHKVSDYYFYNYKLATSSTDGVTDFSSKFDGTLTQASQIEWYAYDATEKYYRMLNNNYQGTGDHGTEWMHSISLYQLSGEYISLADATQKKDIAVQPGDIVYIVACASDGQSGNHGTNKCPIAKYSCRFMSDSYPVTAKDAPEYRTVKWLENNFTEVARISFDEDSKGTTLYLPTGPLDNKTSLPSTWNRRHYGFVYPGLYDYYDLSSIGNTGYYAGLACKHGEYGLFKTLSVTGISLGDINVVEDGASKTYHYGYYTSNSLYDRTYNLESGNQSGYMLYVDASEEARPICSAEFDANLCVGTTFVLSAAVANMTDAQSKTAPQLMFKLYGIDLDAEGEIVKQQLIHSFASCDFSTVCSNELGVWYQVYGKITLQAGTGVEDYTHFLVEVDNYAKNTDGADFAIDDIRFYMRNAKVVPTQDMPYCAESAKDGKGYVTMKVLHESLVAQFGTVEQWYTKKIRYQIRRASDNSVVTDIYGTSDSNTGVTATNEYCEMTFYRYVENETGELTTNQYAPDAQQKFYTLIGDELYFVFEPTGIALLASGEYYVSMQLQTSNGTQGETLAWGEWGSPSDACSVYSEYFTLHGQDTSITTGKTTSDNEIVVPCPKDGDTKEASTSNTITASLTVPDPVHGGSTTVSGILYDWYVGTKEEFNSTKLTNSNQSAKYILSLFRAAYGYASSLENVTATETFTEQMLTDLKSLVSPATGQPTLYLAASSINRSFSTSDVEKKIFNLYLDPVTEYLNVVSEELVAVNTKPTTMLSSYVALCTEGQELSFTVVLGGPKLELGFYDVAYPSGTERSVRLGLKQLAAFSSTEVPASGSAVLRVPINGFTPINSAKTFAIDVHEDNAGIYVYETNDPSWGTLSSSVNVGTVTTINGEVESDRYVEMQFINGGFTLKDTQDNDVTTDFHEGYYYKMSFQIYDKDYEVSKTTDICYGDVNFTLKVVPEYVTWTASAVTGGSTNWNNDENWTRSTRSTLYKSAKGATGTTDNSLAANTDSYEDNGEGTLDKLVGDDGAADCPQSYVPMKFTKVTIPVPADISSYRYPYLSKLDNTTLASGLVTSKSLLNADSYSPTENIQYDIMVKVSTDLTDASVYDCEKFYGNTCAQIYFKPEAELRSQQFLVYDSAWVEKELEPDKWYTLTSPLKAVYAGDMYVPKATGRQTTEAFQPIVFDDATQSSGTYSRNIYPFYQRSWDRASSKIVKDDTGATYAADITYTDWSVGDDSEYTNVLESQWSHKYNDMTEKYWYSRNEKEGMMGFSLKAGCKTSTGTTSTSADKILVRLPKADTRYYYYDYSDKKGTQSVEVEKISDPTKGTVRHGQLLLGKSNGDIARREITLSDISNHTEANGLVLLGNPYMNSLDMSKFFDANSGLERKLWTIVDGTVYAVSYAEASSTLPTIAPMQAFFVKIDSDAETAPTSVLFTTNMTTNTPVAFGSTNVKAKTYTGSRSSAATATTQQTLLSMKAANAYGHSFATVEIKSSADTDFYDDEDVELLYDSNLTELPSLYTVAGTEAVSLNSLPTVDMLPVGIVSSTAADATVTVTGASEFNRAVYLYDSQTGKSTELTDGTELTLAANAHGRYYITSILPQPEDDPDLSGIRCYSPQPGTLVVASPTEDLRQIDIYGIDGTAVKRLTPSGVTSVTVSLPRSIYIVKARTSGSNATVKLRVN